MYECAPANAKTGKRAGGGAGQVTAVGAAVGAAVGTAMHARCVFGSHMCLK